MTYADLLRQNLAAERDYRTSAVDDKWWTRVEGLTAWTDSFIGWTGDEEPERAVPIHFEVCPVCGGRGKYVNPSIDAHGIDPEEFDEDPDFAESYFGGDYDVTCRLCLGSNVVPVPDLEEDRRAIEVRAGELAEIRSDMLAELEAGC